MEKGPAARVQAAVSPYGSARDLPTFRDMELFIQGAKILTIFAPRHRYKLKAIERDMHRMADLVDRFYERLGSRNWIFHDSLNLDDVEVLLDECDEAAAAEERLIELYQDQDRQEYWLMRLGREEGLQARRHQIERALAHYRAEEFDSCVLHLLAVIDGFVNDFQPERRKGLTSREPDEMVAWDSVVGHHLGLTHALQAFRKTIKKRIERPVSELHRHGIVHGSITDFDNVIVATKAWNMLFAIADWAKAANKAQLPVPPEPTFREVLEKTRRNQAVRRDLDAWESSSYSRGDDGFEELEIYRLTSSFLDAWRARNFGAIAGFNTRRFVVSKTGSQLAGEMRVLFDGFELNEFEIQEIENTAPAIWIARGSAQLNGDSGEFECRWLAEDDDGRAAFGAATICWRLYCTPSIWQRDG